LNAQLIPELQWPVLIILLNILIKQKTVVIADNASIHHSDEFNEEIHHCEKKGLFIKYLPPYSPELSHIEIIWKSVKYRWPDISAYSSFENPVKNVENVLKNVGVKYFVEFS